MRTLFIVALSLLLAACTPSSVTPTASLDPYSINATQQAEYRLQQAQADNSAAGVQASNYATQQAINAYEFSMRQTQEALSAQERMVALTQAAILSDHLSKTLEISRSLETKFHTLALAREEAEITSKNEETRRLAQDADANRAAWIAAFTLAALIILIALVVLAALGVKALNDIFRLNVARASVDTYEDGSARIYSLERGAAPLYLPPPTLIVNPEYKDEAIIDAKRKGQAEREMDRRLEQWRIAVLRYMEFAEVSGFTFEAAEGAGMTRGDWENVTDCLRDSGIVMKRPKSRTVLVGGYSFSQFWQDMREGRPLTYPIQYPPPITPKRPSQMHRTAQNTQETYAT